MRKSREFSRMEKGLSPSRGSMPAGRPGALFPRPEHLWRRLPDGRHGARFLERAEHPDERGIRRGRQALIGRSAGLANELLRLQPVVAPLPDVSVPVQGDEVGLARVDRDHGREVLDPRRRGRSWPGGRGRSASNQVGYSDNHRLHQRAYAVCAGHQAAAATGRRACRCTAPRRAPLFVWHPRCHNPP